MMEPDIALLKEENKNLRVRIAYMNADLVRMDILRDEVDSLRKSHARMVKENSSLHTVNTNLKKKVNKLEAKLAEQGGNDEEQDSAEAGSDDRAGDTTGDC